LPNSGREPANSPGFQHYRTTPRETLPDDLITDIYVPLRPR
jgi:AraC family transcriptional regulator